MSSGIYVHIPYCLQRCPYCDFATYEWQQILPPKDYIELVKKEIQQRSKFVPFKKLDTVYFGGGTPSLLEPALLQDILLSLKEEGFQITTSTEITLEINPATINPEKIEKYQEYGFNRFSVGAQSFNDKHLKGIGRKHNSQDVIDTLNLLNNHSLSFSFDLLFSLPNQSIANFALDVSTAMSFSPKHISSYWLTIPENNPLQKGRAKEEEQLSMFYSMRDELQKHGLQQYEISNFSRPGHESRHNMLYWTDQSYWGIGLSAHSYFNNYDFNASNHWGVRFWNPKGIENYQNQILEHQKTYQQFPTSYPQTNPTLTNFPQPVLPSDQFEVLEGHQSLTDFCHTSLRLSRGLCKKELLCKFSKNWVKEVEQRVSFLEDKKYIANNAINNSSKWALTPEGQVFSNQVFAELTFLKEELSS